jgi:hypothetical protein
MRWRREPHSERSSPGSAAFDLECERENLTPFVRTRRGASDHAGARSRVSIPARASIPKAARAGGQEGRRAEGQPAASQGRRLCVLRHPRKFVPTSMAINHHSGGHCE